MCPNFLLYKSKDNEFLVVTGVIASISTYGVIFSPKHFCLTSLSDFEAFSHFFVPLSDFIIIDIVNRIHFWLLLHVYSIFSNVT